MEEHIIYLSSDEGERGIKVVTLLWTCKTNYRESVYQFFFQHFTSKHYQLKYKRSISIKYYVSIFWCCFGFVDILILLFAKFLYSCSQIQGAIKVMYLCKPTFFFLFFFSSHRVTFLTERTVAVQGYLLKPRKKPQPMTQLPWVFYPKQSFIQFEQHGLLFCS